MMDKYARKYMDEQSQQDFYKMFCTEAGNEDCDECLREGACCIDCKWRRSCKGICKAEKARQAMESWPGEKLADALIEIGDEHVIYLVAAERIEHLEKENAMLKDQIQLNRK